MTDDTPCPRPDVVTKKDAAGRWRAACLSCTRGSAASFHKPIADAWRDAHNRRGAA